MTPCTKSDIYRAEFTNEGVKKMKVTNDKSFNLWLKNIRKAKKVDKPGILQKIVSYFHKSIRKIKKKNMK